MGEDVVAGVIERNRKYLITQRKSADALGGCWEFPGGTRHSGESLEECLRRELKEELNIETVVREKLAELPLPKGTGGRTLHFFRCEILSGEPIARGVDALLWLEREEVVGMRLLEPDRIFVEKFLSR